MLTFNTYLILAASIGSVWLIILGKASIAKDSSNDNGCLAIVGGIILFILAIAVFIFSMISPINFGQSAICNDSNKVVRIRYVKYHPFTENTLESELLMPGQCKLIKDSKIVSKTEIEIRDIQI